MRTATDEDTHVPTLLFQGELTMWMLKITSIPTVEITGQISNLHNSYFGYQLLFRHTL